MQTIASPRARSGAGSALFARGSHPLGGLAAPEPPSEGELVPNGSGWLLGRGATLERLHPRLARWLPGVACLAGMGPTWALMLGGHPFFAFAFLFGLLPPAVLFSATVLTVNASLRRLVARARAAEQLGSVPDGTFVRVHGVVVAQPTVPSLFAGTPAVLFRNRLGGADETRGIDFEVELASGERVKVCVRDAFLRDLPRPVAGPAACGPVFCDTWGPKRHARLASPKVVPAPPWATVARQRLREVAVAPGDAVEICGVLDREPLVDAAAPLGRHIPVALVLRSAPATPLLVRLLPADQRPSASAM